MPPSQALAHEFTPVVRQRGDEYLRYPGVDIITGSLTEATALIQGKELYAITIVRHDEVTSADPEVRFDIACTCPYYVDRREGCKHIWATLRAAERQGHLLGSGTVGLTRENCYLSYAEPFDDEGDSDVDASASTARAQASRRPHASAPALPPPPAPSTLFLAAVERRLRATHQTLEATPPAIDGPLLYAIDPPVTAGSDVVLHVMHRRQTKNGPGKPKLLKLATTDLSAVPDDERTTLATLLGATQRDPNVWAGYAPPLHRRPATFQLAPALAQVLLPALAQSGRLWLKPAAHAAGLTPLAWDDGPAWSFRLRVTENDAYTLHAQLHRGDVVGALDRIGAVHVLADALIVVEGTIARFDARTGNAFVHELRRTGPIDVPKIEAPTLAPLLSLSGATTDDLPASLRVTDVRVAPVPRLTLHQRPGGGQFLTELSFDYAGTVTGRSPSLVVFDAARMVSIHRDLSAEAKAAARLGELRLPATWDASFQNMAFAVPPAQVPRVARELIADGWHVDADGARYRVPSAVKLTLSSGIDWFDLSATVDFADTGGVPLTDILAALRGGSRTIRLGDGTNGLLPEEWLKQYGAIAATGTIEGDRIRFTRTQASLLDALLAEREAQATVEVDATFDRVRKELASFTQLEPADPPPSFRGALRPYQRDGLGWFTFLQRFGFGGCLADDMGLGKTIMVLALLDARRGTWDNAGNTRRPSLVVVPRSLVGNWQAEAGRFTPDLRVLDSSHAQRTVAADTFDAYDVVLVTYGTLRRDIDILAAIEFDYVILDEAQAVKNAGTAGAKAVRLLRARHRLALSGTPIENHLGELWSLFEFLNPGVLGRSTVFQRAIAKPDAATTALMSRGLRPFILRRTKAQVASDLPARTEQTILCELGPAERALYNGLREHYRGELLGRVERDGFARSKMHVLEALLRLRQAACHPSLVDRKRKHSSSAKLDVLLPRLAELRAEGHKAIVFSQFTSLLALLRTELDADGVTYEYLDGKTKRRAATVDRFQTDPTVSLFLISLKAGGVGLNLTAAGYVFLLDPWWNPAVEAQAIDRAHRIGQTREVFAYRIIAKDTVEEKVLQLQQSKRDLADAVLAADAVGLRQLEREDLELLLS